MSRNKTSLVGKTSFLSVPGSDWSWRSELTGWWLRCSNLAQKQMRVLAEFGCPGIDRKVVNAGKRLRASLGITEVSVSYILGSIVIGPS